MDLALFGNLLLDDIVLRDGRTLMGEPGGAMLYVSLAARLWGIEVGLVTVAGDDYPLETLESLAARGVDLAGVRRLGRPSVRNWLLYEPGGRQVVQHRDSTPHAEVSPTLDDIPSGYATARAFHLAPMPLERQRELAQGLAVQRPAGAFVSLDPHAVVRAEALDAWRALLHDVDAFFIGEDELGFMRPGEDPIAAARGIAGGRLRWIALKRGARGGTLVDLARGEPRSWSSRAERVVDPTGAGDAFFGGFIAGWLTHGEPGRALEQGVVAASYAIADWGARALFAASPEDARRRLHEWFE